MKLDMGALRAQALEHLEVLWQEQFAGGGFAERPNSYVSVMGTADAAWMLHMLQADEEIKRYGTKAASWLLAQQKPDGRFVHDTPAAGASGYRHSPGHAFWMTVRALNVFGGQLPSFPVYLDPLKSPEGLDKWFRGADWQSPASNHHDVLGLVPLLAVHGDPEWKRTFFRNLASQQDPETFTWCDNKEHRTNVSRTFAYCAIYTAAGLVPPYAPQMVETILRLQRDIGIWETRRDVPEYHTMDATYILWRVGNRIGYPLERRLEALERVSDAMSVWFASHPICRYGSLHDLVANLHTIGLLREALPERYETSVSWLFDWDKAEMFACPAIERSCRNDSGGKKA